MNEIKYQLTQFIFIILLGFAAYWAFTHLDGGVTYARDAIIDPLPEETTSPDDVVNAVNNETVLNDETSSQDNEENSEPDQDEETEPEDDDTSLSEEEQSILANLQNLVDDKVTMDSGSQGRRVGMVQEFLDYYFENKTVTIDNDFGPTTKKLVQEFQTQEMNGGDGRIGPNTLGAMIDYMKK